eukprot:scaffold177886_cov20-Tisochrysis_lutea.AAC.2
MRVVRAGRGLSKSVAAKVDALATFTLAASCKLWILGRMAPIDPCTLQWYVSRGMGVWEV